MDRLRMLRNSNCRDRSRKYQCRSSRMLSSTVNCLICEILSHGYKTYISISRSSTNSVVTSSGSARTISGRRCAASRSWSGGRDTSTEEPRAGRNISSGFRLCLSVGHYCHIKANSNVARDIFSDIDGTVSKVCHMYCFPILYRILDCIITSAWLELIWMSDQTSRSRFTNASWA